MLRRLYQADLEQIVLIEQTVHVVPWTVDTFQTCFDSGYIGWVVEVDKKIIGFILVSLLIECHILNLGVDKGYQRQGFGRKLLEYALDHARHQGLGITYLEVRRSNSEAISLYRKLGFHLMGERKNYYPTLSGKEDALIFAKSLRERGIRG